MDYTWIISGIAITGGLLNAYGERSGFYVWMLANFLWIVHCIIIKFWGQIPMWVVYNVICIIGLYQWNHYNISYRTETNVGQA